MRILVVYATKSGATEDVARRVGRALREAGGDVRVIPADSAPGPEDFDAAVIGSGVRAGKWHRSATDWFNRNVEASRKKPVALFTVGLMIRQGQEKKGEVLGYTDPMIKAAEISPVGIGLFPGWFVPEKFGFGERTILRMMKTPQGDFRDFTAVDSWAAEMAPKLGLEIDMGVEL